MIIIRHRRTGEALHVLRDAETLRGADLREAHVLDADFRGALYDATTHWPRYFRPRWNGCLRRRSPGEVTPAAKPDGNGMEVSS